MTGLTQKVFRVSLNKDKWTDSVCTCKDFGKVYMCEHILSVVASEKLVVIPRNIVECEGLLPKPKRGRKAKATSALKR